MNLIANVEYSQSVLVHPVEIGIHFWCTDELV